MPIRNLYCVPLIYPQVPEELAKKYWLSVEEQITRQEGAFGQVKKIYHEANYATGEEGLKTLHMLNENASQLIDSKVGAGAIVEALEERETVLEIFDCQMFLSLRFASNQVVDKVSKIVPEMVEIYEQAINKRREHIPQQIMNTLSEGETGMLIMREEERVKTQFPSEINVILVMPPVLSEIEMWQKEHLHPDMQV